MRVRISDPKSTGVFAPEDLNTLKAAFDATCARLSVPVEDAEKRQSIIKKLLELANAGEREFASLSVAIKQRRN